jgi:hypothetical protein
MKRKRTNIFPEGWDETRVQKVLAHYESTMAAVPTELAGNAKGDQRATTKAADEPVVMMAIPAPLVPAVRKLLRSAKQ